MKNEIKNEIPIIIFGKNGYNTLGLARSLAVANKPFFLILLSNSRIKDFVLLSKYVKDYIRVTSINDGIKYLLDNYKKAIIVPTSDDIESELDKKYDILIDKFIFPNAGKAGRVTELMDKSLMIKLASACNVPVPATYEYRQGDLIPNNIPFPCLVKPRKTIEGHGKEIGLCANYNELKNFLNVHNKTINFLIQEYIDKEYDILLIGCSCSDGDLYIPAMFKKERWFLDGEDGSFGVITSEIDNNLKENLIKFIKLIKYIGPFSVELGVLKGVPYLYEINLRNDGTSHYFLSLNINIPNIWISKCYGENIRLNPLQKPLFFIDEFGDILNVLRGKITIKQWFNDYKKATIYKYYNSDDLKPLIKIVPYMVILIMYKTLKILLKI